MKENGILAGAFCHSTEIDTNKIPCVGRLTSQPMESPIFFFVNSQISTRVERHIDPYFQDTYHVIGVIFFVLNFQLIMAGRLGPWKVKSKVVVAGDPKISGGFSVPFQVFFPAESRRFSSVNPAIRWWFMIGFRPLPERGPSSCKLLVVKLNIGMSEK